MTRHWTKEISIDMLRKFTGRVRTQCIGEEGTAVLSGKGVAVSSSLSLDHVFEVQFTCFGRDISGVGIRNINGGIEYVDAYQKQPVTIGSKGISFIRSGKGGRRRRCSVFSNFIDWLSFVEFKGKYLFGILSSEGEMDYFILNAPSNYRSLIYKLDVYRQLLLFMPADEYGRVVTRSIESRNRNAVDCSRFYVDDTTLTAFVNKYNERQKGGMP